MIDEGSGLGPIQGPEGPRLAGMTAEGSGLGPGQGLMKGPRLTGMTAEGGGSGEAGIWLW